MSIVSISLNEDTKGNITDTRSNYNPSDNVKNQTARVIQDFTTADNLRNRPYREFNDKSLITRMNTDQRSFNAYVPPKSDNPDEAWNSNAYRPIVRNKIISIAAHVTGTLIFPNVFAQNENDKEDKEAALVMRDLMEFRGEQADYEKTFLYGIISALINPAVIVHTEFREVTREIKVIQEDGSWKKKRIVDDTFSGPNDTVVPLDEIFIADVYESEIQKQPFIIWRKVLDYNTAKAKYGDNQNFKDYVRPGLQLVFRGSEGEFYELYDDEMEERLVEEVIYYNRDEDLQLILVNGVMITEYDQPNSRNDKKYPFAKTGYELIDEGKFFYYRSLANKTSVDEKVVNTLYRMIIDGTFLQIMPPVGTYGTEEFGGSVIAPGKVTSFQNKDSRMETVGLSNNLNAGVNTLNKAEESINESSQTPLQAGQSTKGDQTAFEISRLEQNARIQLGLFGKMIGFLVKQLGDLYMGDILQYMTIGEVSQLSASAGQLRFRNFLLPEKTVDGKVKTREIRFKIKNEEISNEESESFRLLEEEGGLNSEKQIVEVNPTLFRDLKFKIFVSPDVVTPPSDNVKKALNLEAYDRAIANPLVDQGAITRELLLGSYDSLKNDIEKFMSDEVPADIEGGTNAGGLADMAKQAEKVGVTKKESV